MKIKLWQVAVLMAWPALSQPAIAQLPPPRSQFDHPSHRYLPPPVGINSVAEQVRALEQLSAASGADGQSRFELSPAQLKQLDSIVESFRNDKGELELPDPRWIPKQWIDSLLPDPGQRQQVRDVLEEYARTRNLQLDQGTSSSNLTPFDAPNSSSPNSSSANSMSNRAGGSRSTEPSLGPGYNVTRENQSSVPPQNSEAVNGGTSQGRLAELQKLYESLKKIQEQRAQEQQREASEAWRQRSALANDRNRNPSSASGNNPRSTRPSRPDGSPQSGPGASGSKLRDRTDRMPATNQPRPNNADGSQPSRLRPTPSLADDDTANGLRNDPSGRGDNSRSAPTNHGLANNESGLNGGGDDNSALPGGAPPPAEPKAPALTPFDEGYDFSKDQKVAVDPFAAPDDSNAPNSRHGGEPQNSGSQNSARQPRPAKPFDVRRLAQEPHGQPQSSHADSTETGFDLRKSIDQSGLGTTLKRLVQKTLKEQGFDPSQPGMPQPSSSSTAAGGQLPIPDLSGATSPGAVTTQQLKKWANAVANAPSSPANTSTAPANSEWGKWTREVWQAVAEAPARSSSNSSASSARSAAAATSSAGTIGQLPDVRWTGSMTIAVLLVAALIGLLVWLSRRRVAELADATAAQAEWVRTVMAQGLKTRADVVRAFHQLVKQSRAVSDWWTHRSIVKHFSSQTPQLATAISELAVVYEQARYYPEDAELSPQQLAQVRTLLESVKIPSSNRA